MSKLIEIFHDGSDILSKNWKLREVEVNQLHIVKMMEEELYKNHNSKGFFPKELSKEHSFTRICMVNGLNFVVVGSLDSVLEKFNGPITEYKKKIPLFG